MRGWTRSREMCRSSNSGHVTISGRFGVSHRGFAGIVSADDDDKGVDELETTGKGEGVLARATQFPLSFKPNQTKLHRTFYIEKSYCIVRLLIAQLSENRLQRSAYSALQAFSGCTVQCSTVFKLTGTVNSVPRWVQEIPTAVRTVQHYRITNRDYSEYW